MAHLNYDVNAFRPRLAERQLRRRLVRASHAKFLASVTANTAYSSDSIQRLTLNEVQIAARRRGYDVSIKDLGPFYRIVCRDGSQDGRVVGITNGFVAPIFGIMHCDTLQIFTRSMKGEDNVIDRGGALVLSLLLGAATFAYGSQCGCRTAEILAINDDDRWHERLVRYYCYFGFRPVRVVGGNGLADLPHMLVWGGEGTRMDADIGAMLSKWRPVIQRMARAGSGAGAEGVVEGEVERADAGQKE